LLVVGLAGGTEVPLRDVPAFDRENLQANDIVLTFHRWPDEKETAIILQKTTGAGLKKTKEFERLKAWVFGWPALRAGLKAEKVCNSLPELSPLAHCEPDYLLGPARGPG
jgi:hypothetical protein